ncbi:hypothetical protein G6F64_015221 [Rhizopus arrhizus]|uniref:Uncharacterized protein n=1 Tax=Rhizopus oryzae TaxID=64495 RepID=A0A9P6WRY8_RHIOR|nr:hypothetical protein G6F64_015221 [Rhizopus arrhizus]
MAGQRTRADQPGRAPGSAAPGWLGARAGPAGPLPGRRRAGGSRRTGTGAVRRQRRAPGPAQLLVPYPGQRQPAGAGAWHRRQSCGSTGRPARRGHGPAQPHGQHRTGPDQRSTGTHPGRGRPRRPAA